MGLIKDVMKRMKKAVQQAQKPQKLIKWQKRLETARGGQNLETMDKREYLYLGDRAVDKNVNATTTPSKMANNIYNIIYEFVESQVSTQIPQPTVKSKREGFEEQAQMIADSIANDLKESTIDEINDRNERITPVQGFSLIEVCWNPNFKHHLHRGEIELYGRHPKQLVTQPQVYNLHKMDYFFILSDVSQEYVQRRYKKNLEGEEEQFPENTRLFENDVTTSNDQTLRSIATESEDEPLTEIVCWYKDEDGDICKFVWINDIVLEDLPKFFYRRIGGKIVEEETLEFDTVIADGSVLPAGTVVPYFVPERYPVSIRVNVPKNFAFGGQSDVDVIRDQQDSIKRVVHKMEEKLVKGGTIIKALDDHTTFNIDDTIYQIIRGTQAQLAAITTEDLTADITRDIQFVQEQYRMAQSMLGITNSYQGKEDPTAQSGKAKQIQVQQASGRLQSKQFNKAVHFKELFEIIFEFKLALYDELRPYLAQDETGNAVYGQFDKYKFLMKDKTGKLYYNTDFLFATDGAFGLPKDPMFLYEQTLALFQAQAIDIQQLWTIMESLQFPKAAQIKKQWEEKMDQEGILQQLQQQLEQMNGQLQEAQVKEEIMMEMLSEAEQNNMQGQVEAIKELNANDQMERDHASAQQDREHSRNMDIAKVNLEQQKIDAMKQKQTVK